MLSVYNYIVHAPRASLGSAFNGHSSSPLQSSRPPSRLLCTASTSTSKGLKRLRSLRSSSERSRDLKILGSLRSSSEWSRGLNRLLGSLRSSSEWRKEGRNEDFYSTLGQYRLDSDCPKPLKSHIKRSVGALNVANTLIVQKPFGGAVEERLIDQDTDVNSVIEWDNDWEFDYPDTDEDMENLFRDWEPNLDPDSVELELAMCADLRAEWWASYVSNDEIVDEINEELEINDELTTEPETRGEEKMSYQRVRFRDQKGPFIIMFRQYAWNHMVPLLRSFSLTETKLRYRLIAYSLTLGEWFPFESFLSYPQWKCLQSILGIDYRKMFPSLAPLSANNFVHMEMLMACAGSLFACVVHDGKLGNRKLVVFDIDSDGDGEGSDLKDGAFLITVPLPYDDGDDVSPKQISIHPHSGGESGSKSCYVAVTFHNNSPSDYDPCRIGWELWVYDIAKGKWLFRTPTSIFTCPRVVDTAEGGDHPNICLSSMYDHSKVEGEAEADKVETKKKKETDSEKMETPILRDPVLDMEQATLFRYWEQGCGRQVFKPSVSREEAVVALKLISELDEKRYRICEDPNADKNDWDEITRAFHEAKESVFKRFGHIYYSPSTWVLAGYIAHKNEWRIALVPAPRDLGSLCDCSYLVSKDSLSDRVFMAVSFSIDKETGRRLDTIHSSDSNRPQGSHQIVGFEVYQLESKGWQLISTTPGDLLLDDVLCSGSAAVHDGSHRDISRVWHFAVSGRYICMGVTDRHKAFSPRARNSRPLLYDICENKWHRLPHPPDDLYHHGSMGFVPLLVVDHMYG